MTDRPMPEELMDQILDWIARQPDRAIAAAAVLGVAAAALEEAAGTMAVPTYLAHLLEVARRKAGMQ